MPFRLTELAEADLESIAAYTADQWGETQALTYTGHLTNAFRKLGDNPLSPGSRKRDELAEGCRILAVEKHLIVYRHQAGLTEILRILHQRMDLLLQRLF
ncbi:type II toxin-antitoxin system RelE/ParE family toxin [Nitrospirillum sp. BR 11163]|uniref:type II toxin-antitoxin system RelE/ParE family toxin n=1 Tax=Nitrospirillum sp. BR 11163 TaxID=3104323 RepID=UPI002B000186|nr:type II toxin-antitoxin system RelE/ParE family toxin [Nitrospirillum sp. BR 11163]MEA1677427.1 type II toxin-antitoxin system RelE/ParE family toxin [Nitrospirillum sp. BR 11163]